MKGKLLRATLFNVFLSEGSYQGTSSDVPTDGCNDLGFSP